MKNKKAIVGILLLVVVGIVGATIAFYNSTDVFENIFGTQVYKMEVYETFESPDDWTPGTTTPKSVTAKNVGNVDAAVRISFTEEWKDSEGQILPLVDENNNRAAIIDFTNSFKKRWTTSVEDGKTYYYYKSKISKNETTTTLIDSVTFNSALNIDSDHSCRIDDVTGQQVCTTSTTGYSGGTYTLVIKVETVQYDKYKDAWGTNVEIFDDMPMSYSVISGDVNTVGSIIRIKNEEFYVMGQEDSTHVKLFPKYNLNVGNNLQEGTEGLQNSLAIGYNGDETTKVNNYFPATVAFSSTNYWDGTPSYPSYIYTNNKVNNTYQASIASYIDNYVEYLENQGAYTTGRLMSQDDLISLGCSSTLFYCDEAHGGAAPEWVYSTSYWLGTANSYDYVGVVHSFGDFSSQHYDNDDEYGVRPVIILEK